MEAPSLLQVLTRHDTIVALAIVGGLLSVTAIITGRSRSQSTRAVRWLDYAAYAFMGASVLLFIIAGLIHS